MTTTTLVTEKRSTNKPVYLPVGQTSGSFIVSIPFVSEYIMILNDTEATIAVCIGEQATQGPEAQIWSPGRYLSLPLIQETQKLTIFWSSASAISANNNLVQFYFSNVTIPLQGGNFGETASNQNVDVLNTVQVQFVGNQPVDVKSLPNVLPLSLTAGPISSSQTTVTTIATALINGVVNGKLLKIKNIDATNSIFIGNSGVTGANGYELFPKEEHTFSIVPGSNIVLYGIATAGTPIASILVLN